MKGNQINQSYKFYTAEFEKRRQISEKSLQDRLKTIIDIYHKQKQQIWDDDQGEYKKKRRNNRISLARNINKQIKKTINKEISQIEYNYTLIREKQVKELEKEMENMYKEINKDYIKHQNKVQEYYSISTEHTKGKNPDDMNEFIEDEVRDEGDARV